MRNFILVLLFCLNSVPALASHPISSAQFTDAGRIHVTLDDGRMLDVPDNPANRHRRMITKWVGEGNTITPADPPPVLTRKERIRRDPDYPQPSEFTEAFIDCRFNSNCSAAQALRNRLNDLRVKYP